MATQWLDADFDTIHRLALMRDAAARGEGSVTLRREIGYLEDAFGLNPASRARLRWVIEDQKTAGSRSLHSRGPAKDRRPTNGGEDRHPRP